MKNNKKIFKKLKNINKIIIFTNKYRKNLKFFKIFIITLIIINSIKNTINQVYLNKYLKQKY